MDNDIKKLIEKTTIVKVDDNMSRKTIFGDEHCFSRFLKNQGQQVILNTLENNWNNIWKSFGDKWGKKRQNYRFLYDSFRLFYFSFEQLRFNKVAGIREIYGNKNWRQRFHFAELTGVGVYGMYHHGKKCIDLLKTLQLIDKTHKDWDFCKKISETRNKLIEHNHNPRDFENLQIDPSIWSLASTNSFLEIQIHLKDTKERAYDAYIDYYEDYYRLEKIITDIIQAEGVK
jgi:hypothetical protein